VIVFKREGDGEGQGVTRSYEATHVDRFSNDETITTARRKKAVRFAVAGTTKGNPSERGLQDQKGQGLGRAAAVDSGALDTSARAEALVEPGSERASTDLDPEGSSGVAGVPGQIHAAEAYVVELRQGQYWVDVPDPKGKLTATADPSRASTVSSADMTLLSETFAAFPTARVLKIRVTVAEVLDGASRPC
jgi:hypothetical protein